MRVSEKKKFAWQIPEIRVLFWPYQYLKVHQFYLTLIKESV